MENASAAFLDAVRKSMRAIRGMLGATSIDPKLLTAAERLRYEGYLRREEANAEIVALAKEGLSIKHIVRRTRHSRNFVRRIVRGEGADVLRTRQASLDRHLTFLEDQWSGGCRKGAELWRRLRAKGFQGAPRVVGEWATRRRRAERSSLTPRTPPSARTIARLMTLKRDHMTKSETVVIAAIETGVPTLADARPHIEAFHQMIRNKIEPQLEPWLLAAKDSLVGSFARGIARDVGAVRAAIASPWSNGQVEGQITKLKLVKRQMYGRAKLDLLEARLIGNV